MIYSVKVKKRLRYVRVYTILKRMGPKENFLTRVFANLAAKKTKKEDQA